MVRGSQTTEAYPLFRALSLRVGEQEAVALFYAAMLALVRSGIGERQLQRHLVKVAKSVTAEELVAAGLGGITANAWSSP